MLTITLTNDGTGTNQKANYDYRVYVNSREIANGRIYDHNRNTGWQGLVAELNKVSNESNKVETNCERIKQFLKLLEEKNL